MKSKCILIEWHGSKMYPVNSTGAWNILHVGEENQVFKLNAAKGSYDNIASRASVLNLWVTTLLGVAYQIFRIFIL